MCYTIPGKVKEIGGKTVVVDYFGQEKRAINEFYDLTVGDYVSAQGGFIIKKVAPAEAEEILSSWKELFFELQEMDLQLSGINLDEKNINKRLRLILDRALENIPLEKKDLLHLLDLSRTKDKEILFKAANFLRQKYHQNACCIHGIIEISNFCKQSCQYCGISAQNKNLTRYRMSPGEIINTAVEAVEKYGFQALVLQSGEDCNYPVDDLTAIIEQIKARSPVLICISFGEVGLDGLDKLYKAGARGLLMRFETSNPQIFARLNPGKTLESRLNHIRKARELGYIIMTGALIGLPGQTKEDIVNDIYLTKALGAEMYSFGPFLAHPDSPLAGYSAPSEDMVLKTLALARLIDPQAAKILVTTAFETLSSKARKRGLLSGANSVMLNLTPLKYRRYYAIYPDKAYADVRVDEQIQETIALLKSLGRAPTDLGVSSNLDAWASQRIRPEQIHKYMPAGRDFIPQGEIFEKLSDQKKPGRQEVKDILAKSLAIQTLTLDETGTLLGVNDPKTLELMRDTALKVKKKVYDNRIVTFAPLYLGNYCSNDCLYCGFRSSNPKAKRSVLNLGQIQSETRVLAGQIGHKRLIVVYGEHPSNDISYMVDSIRSIYSVKEKTRRGFGQIRRVNVNAAPLPIEELKLLKGAGIGTYQVFQETYHKTTYKTVHPPQTIKGNYYWRLYALHRALEAGIDDVGLGVLFGLYDWKFEVMGLVAHNRELEETFGIGAHTISFPRLEPAENTPFSNNPQYKVSDADFMKLVTVIRLAVPHAGLIITCRETPEIKRQALNLGITQTDASTKIGIGSYSEQSLKQEGGRQQFILADTRSLDEMIREFAQMGIITSFCTAGYRCGRTGKCIKELLKTGAEGKFCKLNAVLTFQEWLDDFAGPETKQVAEKVIAQELKEIEKTLPKIFPQFRKYYQRIKTGERDLYF